MDLVDRHPPNHRPDTLKDRGRQGLERGSPAVAGTCVARRCWWVPGGPTTLLLLLTEGE